MLDQQHSLELDMLNRGNQRYWKQQTSAVEQGRGDETGYSKRLLPDLVVMTANGLIDRLEQRGRGRESSDRQALRKIDPSAAALITMRVVLQSVTKPSIATSTALLIGKRIEDEMRLAKFEREHENYFKQIKKDFVRKGTTDYRYMHRVMIKTMNDHKVEWEKWPKDLHLRVGATMLQTCIESTGAIRYELQRDKKKTTRILLPTLELLSWIQEHMDQMEMLNPDLGPCVIPPREWKGIRNGGYYIAEVADRVPFIKIRNKEARESIKSADLSTHMAGVNAIQNTAWQINADVLSAMRSVYATGNHPSLPRKEPYEFSECPVKDTAKEDFTDEEFAIWKMWCRETANLHTLERERVGKNIQFLRVLRQADTYAKYPELYFVYQCDFRGRVYATSTGVSPQGADFSKALLSFKKSKPLGQDGWDWLRIRGASLFGVDKVCMEERIRYIDDNRTSIISCADDPVGNKLWAEADKPWQFLAFCFEYRAALASGNPLTFESTLPVGVDGSCNGLQNFSAMLRDAVGGAATNLIPSDLPADIYQEVANVVLAHLKGSDNPLAKQWLEFGVTRKCTKTPVMTLPYGSTQMTCTDAILDYLKDNQDNIKYWLTMQERMQAAVFLSSVVWASIGEVVIAARAAMKWIQDCSRIMTRAGKPLRWTTPTGFVVYQANKKSISTQVKLRLMKGASLQTSFRLDVETDVLCSLKQANGSAPNFIHSMDCSHMILSILEAKRHGVVDFAMIHDDFGCHACDVPVLNTCIRKAFVGMYEKHDVLQEFADELGEDLPAIPSKGNLDIKGVLKSTYFFS